MRVPVLRLLRKEARQNALVYLFPLPFWLALVVIRASGGAGLPAWLGPVFTYAVPFTLAVAYGLQAFDVEEDAQTRDFLLVKPLSTWQIVLGKLLAGLVPLLIWVLLFLIVVNRPLLVWPRPEWIPSWSGGLLLAGAILAYGASFLAGLMARGPKKLLAAPALALAFMAPSFLVWSSWVTFLVHQPAAADHETAVAVCFYLAAGLVLAADLGCLLGLAVWILRSRPGITGARALQVFLVLLAFLSLVGPGLNFLAAPPLRAAQFLGLELFGLDRPLWTVEGAWRPYHDEIAVACPGNALGLARPGQKPVLIYQGQPKQRRALTNLAWSPDGKYIAFVENGRVCLLRPGDEKTYPLGLGFAPCWSHDGSALVFATEEAPARRIQTESGVHLQHTLKMRRVDLRRGTISPYVRVNSLSRNWHWDSARDRILTVDFWGRLWLLGTDRDRMLVPPDSAGSGVFWHGLYPLSDRPGEFVLAIVSISDAERQRCTARFYRYDAEKSRLVLLDKLCDLGLVNFIFDPATGTYLVGRDGIYRRRHLRGLRGVIG